MGWDALVEVVEELNLKSLRLSDVIAIPKHHDACGRGRFEGAMTIGVIVHGFYSPGGHGPGLNPIMADLPGKIKTKIDPHANVAYYLGIRDKPKKNSSFLYFCLIATPRGPSPRYSRISIPRGPGRPCILWTWPILRVPTARVPNISGNKGVFIDEKDAG